MWKKLATGPEETNPEASEEPDGCIRRGNDEDRFVSPSSCLRFVSPKIMRAESHGFQERELSRLSEMDGGEKRNRRVVSSGAGN